MTPGGNTESSKRPRRVAVVVNPNSGSGRTRLGWRRLEQALKEHLGDYTLLQTTGPGDATTITRNALEQGFECIVSAGGDGTHFEVVNGFFQNDKPINPDASMGILPFGTGSDLPRTLQVPRGPGSVEILAHGTPIEADVGRAEVTTAEGERVVRYFLSTVHMGIGSVTAEIVNRRSKLFGGFLSFYSGVLSARFAYDVTPMTITMPDRAVKETCLDVIVANGRFDAGGMHVAPQARLDDGAFDVYVIGNTGTIGTIMNIPRMYRGTHETHPKVTRYRANRVEVTSDSPILSAMDGEVMGNLPATYTILPGALRLHTGPNTPEALAIAHRDAPRARGTAV